MKRLMTLAVIALVVLCSSSPVPAGYGLKKVTPESAGMNSERLSLIDSVIAATIAEGNCPGAVVAVVRGDQVVFEKAYGHRQLVPHEEPMTVGTVFDLASLSKCVGTTTSIMQLLEQGKIRLSDPVKYYIPEFAPWENVDITVRDLLTHTSGVDSYVNVVRYLENHPASTPDSLMHYIATSTGRHFRPGTDMIYSCLNFVTLQNILQNVTGERLCDYAKKNVFEALGMQNTCYFPTDEPISPEVLVNIAPTEVQPDGLPLRGQVHDPIARRLNYGNSGNAGVFSNAEDLEIFAAAIMNGGEWNGHRVLSPMTINTMATVPAANDPRIGRALGWDNYSGSASPRGDFFSRTRSICHTGYTGTSMVMDLDNKVAVIILTNRVHPKDEGGLARTRAVIANIVASSIEK